MLVMKFGGTSVGSSERIRNTCQIIKSARSKNPVVVVSAVTKITDALISLAKACAEGNDSGLSAIIETHSTILSQLELDKNLLDKDLNELKDLVKKTKASKKINKQILDHFQSFGERMSSKIVAAHLSSLGINAKAFNAWDIGMITDDDFGNAEPLRSSYAKIKESISKIKEIPVITGFIGRTANGEIITMGRGGSDYTAAIIGAAIGAECIVIWTDVNGIMTTDPRIVPEARTVPELAFEEACELAYFGAKVIHPKTILPAMEKGIPVKVLNSFNPKHEGTTIVSTFEARKNPAKGVEAFSYKKDITAIHIRSPEFFEGSGLMAGIFSVFEKHRKSVDIVSTSVVSVSLTIDTDENLSLLVSDLQQFGAVEVVKDKAIICAVGGRKHAAQVAAAIFNVLGNNKISVEMISQASSGISITFVVSNEDAPKAIQLLHKEFFG